MSDLTDAQLDQLISAIGLKRPRGGSQRKPIAHGTYAGAQQHRYRHEPVCEACLAASAAYQRGRHAARKRAATEQRAEAGLPNYLTEAEWQARIAARNCGAR